jgi:hypothetical protein
MKLYEINEAVETLLAALTVDPETGEVPADADEVIAQLDALAMEKRAVLEYLAKVVLNLRADQAAVKAEEARLKERRERMERREASVMAILDRECAGEKTDLGVATVSYRASEATEITSEADARTWLMSEGYDDCLKYAEPAINKAALKKLIKSGVAVPGACVTVHNNCSLN